MNRWRDHIYDAFDPKKDHCKLLNRAIRKYGGDAFKVEVIEECDEGQLNDREYHHIVHHNTIKPYGYNLSYGGASSHLEETKERISLALKGRPKSHESLLKRSVTKKGGNTLPMYLIEYKKNGVVMGYRVTHPQFSERRFGNPNLTLEENLNLAQDHLQKLNSMDKVQRLDGDGS